MSFKKLNFENSFLLIVRLGLEDQERDVLEGVARCNQKKRKKWYVLYVSAQPTR